MHKHTHVHTCTHTRTGRTKTRRNSQKARKVVKGTKQVALTTQQSQDDPQDSLNLFQNSLILPQGTDLTESLVLESGSLFSKRTSRDDHGVAVGNLPEIQLIKVRTAAATTADSPREARNLIVENHRESQGVGAQGVKDIVVVESHSESDASGAQGVKDIVVVESRSGGDASGAQGVKDIVVVESRSGGDASGAQGVKDIVVESRSGVDDLRNAVPSPIPPVVDRKEVSLLQAVEDRTDAADTASPPSQGEVEFVINIHNTSTPTTSTSHHSQTTVEPTQEEPVTVGDTVRVEVTSSSIVSDFI